MVGGLGWTEILLLTGAVIIFLGGGNQLPELARSLGEAIQEFRNATNPDRETSSTELSEDDNEPSPEE